MAFRTRRQQFRYNRLVTVYKFLPFEARELSKVPFKTPYMRGGIRERIRAYRTATREYKARDMRLTKAEWVEIIREMYMAREWMRKGKGDPWQMLRAWEDKYRDKRPEYESPPKARKVKVKRKDEFVSKYAKGLEAYDKGRMR